MKEVLGSLPEVITAYKNYNLLVPTATDVQLNPFYKFHVEEVPVDLGENSGDIFKVGSVKTGKQDERGKDIWEDVFSLSKPLLNKMAMAAGIQFNPKETYGERIDRVTYRAQAQGAMRKADGTARTETDQKVICLEDEEEKYRLEFADKAAKGITDEKQAQAAAEIFSGQWVESKNKWGKKCQAFVVAKEDRDRYIDRSVIEVNEAHVQELIDTAFEGLTYVGTTTLDGGEIALQYTVNEGETLSGIMEQYGVVWSEVEQQIREANPEIKDLNLIYPDQVINIPEAIVEAASVDASQVGEAAKEAAENETGQTIEEEQPVKTTLKNEGVESSEVGQAAEEAAKNETGEVLEREQPVKTNMTNAGVDDSQVTQAAQEQETQAEPKETQVPTTIKFEVASLDDSALASAISEKLQQGEAVPVTVPANVTIQAGTIDDGALSSEIGSKLGEQSPVPVTVPADITMTAGSINSSPAVEAAQTDITSAFATALPADGTVDVTLAKGVDNIAALYAEVGGLVRSAWASPYSASGVVNVTLTANYSLANPTKTISFGGGATGSATVSASLHALGGIFDEPHLGIVAEAGPESIIPLDGSDRSLSLFEQTGEMLGVLNSGEGKSVEAPVQTANAPQSLSQPVGSPQTCERVIRLEIGGQGSINVSGSGVSKEKIVDAMMENLRDVFMNIVQQEIIEEGEGAYEF